MRRLAIVLALLTVSATLAATVRAGTRPHAGGGSSIEDFNGDGFADLAVAVPFEDIGTISNSGAVNVLYGSATGLTDVGNQFWNQESPDIEDQVDASDEFGLTLAHGDFNGDGFTDLAVGVPLEDIGITSDAGGVNVIYGSPTGLDALFVPDQFWSQDSTDILDDIEPSDQFGNSLAAGDFDMDGFADLAVGVPNENLGNLGDAGAINLIYGSASGLTAVGNQLWTQDVTGVLDTAEADDFFAESLASGDVNGDTFPDLVVGVSQEDIGENLDFITDAGAIQVLLGGASGISSTGNQFFHQNTVGLLGEAEESDQFGLALASGNFNGDAFDDVAVGVSEENLNPGSDVGVVNVLLGSANGLTDAGDQMIGQDSPGILDSGESGDEFGFALAVGNFDGDGFDDLSVGIPDESFGMPTIGDAGMVATIYGGPSGLSTRDQFWTQNSVGIQGSAESSDNFGQSLVAGDYNGDTFDDVSIGVPNENVDPISDSGSVSVILGSATGLVNTGNQFWAQDVPPQILDQGENSDNFGFTMG